MTAPSPAGADAKAAERARHLALMGKITVWSGWVLAFASLFIGGTILNKMNAELHSLRRENRELRAAPTVSAAGDRAQ